MTNVSSWVHMYTIWQKSTELLMRFAYIEKALAIGDGHSAASSVWV